MKNSPTAERFEYRSFYRRNLPHIQPLDADLFVTFRLAGSLPKKVLAEMAEERRWREEISTRQQVEAKKSPSKLTRRHFAVLEKYLDNPTTGPTWLRDSRIAGLVSAALHFRDGRVYRLDAFTIMPNHVHCIFQPMMRGIEPYSLSSIMHSLKRHTARKANELLNRCGKFWAHESFDHYIRDGVESRKIIAYVLQNPVKAGLAEHWQDWPWTYVRAELLP
jgi:REP-associated tyrosine transposase